MTSAIQPPPYDLHHATSAMRPLPCNLCYVTSAMQPPLYNLHHATSAMQSLSCDLHHRISAMRPIKLYKNHCPDWPWGQSTNILTTNQRTFSLPIILFISLFF